MLIHQVQQRVGRGLAGKMILRGDDIGEIPGDAVVVEAGAAGQNLHALVGQRLEVIQAGRALAGEVGAAVVEEHGCRQLVLLGHGIDKGLHEVAAELV